MKRIIKSEKKWLEMRTHFVTASNAATLVGLNPYSSPGRLKSPEPFEGNAFTKVGQMLEPVVVNVVNSVLNTEFVLFETEQKGKVFYTNGSLGATPDAYYENILLECKTTRPHTYHKYAGYPNVPYLIQAQVQLCCTGRDIAYLAILNTDLTQQTAELHWPIVIYKTEKNMQICEILQEEATRFLKSKSFRVNSEYKKLVKLLLSLSYEKIY